MESVHVAVSSGGSGVLPASDKAVAFQGLAALTILPGGAVWSDAFDFDLAALTNVAVTIRFDDTPAAVTGHPGSRATSYLRREDAVTAPDMADAAVARHWYVLTGIDADADAGRAAVVALGDSITDGRGSTTDGNNRWTDDLALRLAAVERPLRTAVVNEGIGGNAVLAGGLGPTAMARFDRDVLSESGVRWVILFEGVNDIGGSRDPSVAAGLIAAYRSFIAKAHGKGLRIYGATITPFGGSMYFTPAHEAARKIVNTWIRMSGKV
jgi:lysophospholipase L1-like esterase